MIKRVHRGLLGKIFVLFLLSWFSVTVLAQTPSAPRAGIAPQTKSNNGDADFVGPLGGPFSPAAIVFSLFCPSDNDYAPGEPIELNIFNISPLITINPTFLATEIDASNSLTIGVTSAANTLSPGLHRASFDATCGSGDTISDPTRFDVSILVEDTEEDFPPTASIISPVGNQTITVGDSVNFSGQVGGTGSPGNPVFAWDFGDGRTSTALAPGEIRYDIAGTYTVEFKVTDLDSGLFATDTVVISVQDTLSGPDPDPDDDVSKIIDDFEQVIPNLPTNEVAALASIATSVTTNKASAQLTADFGLLQQAAQANDPNIARAVGRATPDQTQAPSDASLNSVGLQIGNIGARLMALRMGTASGFDLAGLSIDIDGNRISGRQMQGLMEAFANGGAASADDSVFSRLGVFVSGRLSRGTRDATDNVEGFKYRVTGLTAGADYRLQDDLIVGGALGYSRAKTDIRDDGGDVDADNYSATLYGTWYQDSGVFVDGSLTYSRGDFDQQRNVNYTLPTQGVTVDQIFDASFKGQTFGVAVSGGYEFRQDALTLVPFARLQYLRARIDGYQETVRRPGEPGSGFGVEIDKQRFTSFTSALGVQANYAISQPWGVLMPFASVEWVHEFDKSNDNVTGRFLGDRGGNTFSFAVDDTDSNYFDLGVGVAAQFTQGTSGFVNYQRIEGFSNLSHYSVNAGLRFEF